MANIISYGVTGTGGDYFGTPITYSIAASGNQVIPKGYYYVVPDANGTVQINIGGTWTSMGPAGDGKYVFSDGVSIRVLAGATASTTQAIPILRTV